MVRRAFFGVVGLVGACSCLTPSRALYLCPPVSLPLPLTAQIMLTFIKWALFNYICTDHQEFDGLLGHCTYVQLLVSAARVQGAVQLGGAGDVDGP